MNTISYYEVLFCDGYGICIKATKKPTHSEAAQFLANDMEKWGYSVSDIEAVYKILHGEAVIFYDMERESEWPVFTGEVKA